MEALIDGLLGDHDPGEYLSYLIRGLELILDWVDLHWKCLKLRVEK